jgi:hypothetical protein
MQLPNMLLTLLKRHSLQIKTLKDHIVRQPQIEEKTQEERKPRKILKSPLLL